MQVLAAIGLVPVFAFPARHEATLPVLWIHRALGPAQMLNFVQQDAPALPRLRHHPPAFHDLADAVSGGFHLQLGSDGYVMQIVMYATRLQRWQPIERMLWPNQHAKLSQLAARQGP